MEEYFRYYATPRKDRLSTSLGQPMGESLKWWNKEEYERLYYEEPKIKTWDDLKWTMYKRYSSNTSKQNHLPSK